MIRIGQIVKFDAFEDVPADVVKIRHVTTGTVVYINEKHHWFSVEYGNPKARISFNFCEIGKAVKIVG